LGFSQQPAATIIAGGPGGTPFSDTQIPYGVRILEVHIFAAKYVDAVQLQYELPNGQILMGPKHGGSGGRESILRIDSDEYIVGISGRFGNYIDSIQFHTNKRSSEVFGGTGGRQDYAINVANDHQAAGFVGRAGAYLDAIGLTYVPQTILRMQQTSLAGGTGGREFVDSQIPANSRISEVRIRSAKMIDSIQAVYTLQNGVLFEGPAHGGNGGQLSVFKLDSDEYIVGLGYKIKNVAFTVTSMGGGGKKTRLSSDLDIKVDFSIRNNRTVLRRIDQDIDQVSSGMRVISINTSIDYMLSKSVTLRLFFDKIINNPFVSNQYKNSTGSNVM
jgi:hypothetical protein